MMMGIVGLGLIGGSLAKAYKRAGATVLGYDQNTTVTEFAKMAGAIDGDLDKTRFPHCDLILIAIPPVEAEEWLRQNGEHMTAENIVIDCCGTKRCICKVGFALAAEHGFHYAGGHPMAGIQHGGFKNSTADLFDGAVFALVPPEVVDFELIERIKRLILPAGFSKLVYATADEHDRMIAFTSQMAHVVSNAFIKSPTALDLGVEISAGSYKDFTRVAMLEPHMWTELFIENKDYLLNEIDGLIHELARYAQAIKTDDADQLAKLLREGRERKLEVDYRCN